VRLRVVVIFGLLLSLPLLAQSHREAITVEVVDVPVHVTHNGLPVEGLAREDFELFVNGKPQSIEYFDEIRKAAPASMRERRLFLLLFDIASSMPHAIERAQKAALQLVSDAPQGDTFAVATYSGRRGVEFAVPFTSDHAALVKAIAQLGTGDEADPLRLVVTASERGAIELENQPTLDALLATSGARDVLDSPRRRASEHRMTSLGEIGERLAQLEGHKHVIFLSQGSPVSENPFAAEPVAARPAELIGDPSWWRAMEELYRSYQSSGVFLHTLNTNGLRVVLRGVSDDPLRNLSRGTGGRTINNRNDFANALADLANTQRSGYLLGFRPANAKRGHNKVVVKVKNAPRGSRVTYRYGFSGIAPHVNFNDGLYLADVILNDVPQTGIAAALESSNGSLVAKLPTRTAAAQLGKDGTAELLVYIFDEHGVAVDYRRELIDVPANATQDDTLTLPLALPPGKYMAKALLRVDGSLGFSRTEIVR